MGRRGCCRKEGIKRGAWTAIEDQILSDFLKLHPHPGIWRNLPLRAGLNRCGKSCRLRWLNYLRPDIKRGNITNDEEDLIIRLHKLLGNRWSLIAKRLPGRTDNEVKNYWNTVISKKLKANLASFPNPNSTKSPSKNSLSSTIRRSTIHRQSPEKESRAIRTKALRCTRTLYDQCGDVAVGPGPLDDEKSPPLIWKDPEPSDFVMDFDIDDKFLSDFLNTETLGPKTSSSSLNIDENYLLSSGEITPLLDYSLNWPLDQ